MQLCHSAFADVLFANNPDKLISNEAFVFQPLMRVGKKVKGLRVFEVEVDWPAGEERWDEHGSEMGFRLSRVGSRMRAW